VLSLGLGLTVLVAIALIEGNMARQVQEELPDDAPAFFFVDIQPDQIEPFTELMAGIDGTSELEEVPSLRGRIVAVNGTPADEALVDPEQAWLLRGDRGVTYRSEPRPSDTVVAGEWWPEDYAGPPLLSIYQDIATAFDIGLGDTMTINVLGRDLTAEVANIRDIDWSTLSINFTLVFSPAPLNAAPHTFIATVQATEAAEGAVQRQVTDRFANVTAVRVRDALDAVNDILGKIATAVRGTAGITLVAGTLVLAGAIAAGHRRRVYDSVVLKVLGATRGDVLRAFSIEYGLLGLLTAAIAAAVGTLTAWAVLTFVMQIDWVFLPLAVLATAAVCTAITLAFGFVGTWRALGQKAAPLLRNE
jgi:putative ABC transport system permease protein